MRLYLLKATVALTVCHVNFVFVDRVEMPYIVHVTLYSQLNKLPVLCMFHPITLKNFSFHLSPVCPEEMDWSKLYPHFFTDSSSEKETPRVEFADIGCGYGGLLGSH